MTEETKELVVDRLLGRRWGFCMSCGIKLEKGEEVTKCNNCWYYEGENERERLIGEKEKENGD